ncbi:adrenodoxin isoform X2 [Hyalella azteca]|uniref:Adrenodoxin isoform X2 n=1 Tax=Hyalella azteca TaxID=294128 RepID=A0A8B7N386_HYAAZ|nr:adrenodoxin isoform X2 [Hyalella azteca]
MAMSLRYPIYCQKLRHSNIYQHSKIIFQLRRQECNKFYSTARNLSSNLLNSSTKGELQFFTGLSRCAVHAGRTNRFHTSVFNLTDKIKISFKTENDTVTLAGSEGDSLLDIVNNNNYQIDGYGACDGTVACSTCHVVLDQATFDAVNKGITEEEKDLLDMASDVEATSRLGCQVYVTPAVDGATVVVPAPVDLRDL